jgi:hypothetical protein
MKMIQIIKIIKVKYKKYKIFNSSRRRKILCITGTTTFSLLLLFLIKMNYNNILVNFAGSLYNSHLKFSKENNDTVSIGLLKISLRIFSKHLLKLVQYLSNQ